MQRVIVLGIVAVALSVLAAPASADSITSGNVGVSVSTYAAAGASAPSGNLSVAAVPAGATILSATLYADNYFSSLTPSATFGGTALGSTSAYSVDTGSSAYRWDVTSLISGNGLYSASATGLSNNYGMSLVVIYSDASLASRRIEVQDSIFDHLGGTESRTFDLTGTTIGAGSDLWVRTGADNNGGFGQSGESVVMNGTNLGGPLDANNGAYASLFTSTGVSVVSGLNTLSIVNPNNDQFGWDFAILSTPTNPIPEPTSLALLGLGAAGLAVIRRRGRSRA